jgi:hypothetical protein
MAVIPTSGLKRKHSNESLAQKDQLFDFYAPDSKRRSGNQFSTTSSRAASSDSPATRLAGMSLDGSGSAFSSSTLGGMISLNAAPDAEMYAPPPSSGPSGAFSSKNPQMSASMGLPPKKQRFGPHPRGVGTTEASGIVVPSDLLAGEDDGHGHSKKKYAKEAWPKDLRPTSVL